jgi:signal transduction histidine kinase
MLFFLWGESKRLQRDSQTILTALQRRSVISAARSLLQARITSLKILLPSLEMDNPLAQQVLVAGEEEKMKALQPELDKLKQKTGCEVAALTYSFKGQSVVSPGSPSQDFSHQIPSSPRGLSVVFLGERPALIAFGPLKHYGKQIGKIAIGYFLDERLAREISEATQSQVSFFAKPSNNAGTESFPVSLDGFGSTDKIDLKMAIENSQIPLAQARVGKIITSTATFSICILILLLAAFWDIGFVRGFKKVIKDINQMTEALDRGEVLVAKEKAHPVREVKILSAAFSKFGKSLQLFRGRVEDASKREAVFEIAEQVTHDLKSPLTALKITIDSPSLKQLPTRDLNLIKGCVERLNDITSVLQEKSRQNTNETLVAIDVRPLILRILEEKRTQYIAQDSLEIATLDVEGVSDNDSLLGKVQPREFQRVISNLLDNAAQAVVVTTDRKGLLQVHLRTTDQWIHIEIADNGKGIPADKLLQLGQRKHTFGKEGGTGLGLYHALITTRYWGGDLEIHSVEGTGTKVQMRIPRAQAGGSATC